ncbi:hypothetical protein GCM10022224_073600 [Nonomuraea antimicrobica]|uniref:Uncharacterized protein n=1 Tax=Nonomuraea antimicrobica TaxID=561173 RepID=A0ABP7CZN5_9ACTN
MSEWYGFAGEGKTAFFHLMAIRASRMTKGRFIPIEMEEDKQEKRSDACRGEAGRDEPKER